MESHEAGTNETNSKSVRVKPRSFNCDWTSDLLLLGIRIPENIPDLQYSPADHNPMPFSLEIDICSMTLLRRWIGVMPNALYKRHIYSWDEFCNLVKAKEGRK